jgi:hypothetical protein
LQQKVLADKARCACKQDTHMHYPFPTPLDPDAQSLDRYQAIVLRKPSFSNTLGEYPSMR